MNCDQTQQCIDDYLDDELDTARRTQLNEHVSRCPDCCRALNQTRELRARLQALPVPEPRPGFARQALRQARRHHEQGVSQAHGQRHWFMAGFATAAVAGLALWAVLLVFTPGTGPGELPRIALTPEQTRTVQLVFNSPRDLDGVTLSMRLPANFELAGYPGRQQLTWETNLRKGRNVLALPVRATNSGTGELIANMRHEDGAKTFRVRLNAAASPTSRNTAPQMIVG